LRTRFFEVAKGFEDKNINLPRRTTKHAAGYDLEAAEDVIIKPFHKVGKPTLVPTGIKVFLQEDELLLLCNRSSNPTKRGLVMINGIGIIDADYYGNPTNDGAMSYNFINIKDEDILIKKGERIGQAIFQKYLITDDDNAEGERLGGFGSTDK